MTSKNILQADLRLLFSTPVPVSMPCEQIIHVFATKTHGREQKCHATITITDNERAVKGYGKINAADGLEQLEHIW